MKQVAIPETNLSVSNICMGTAVFGSALSEETAFAFLDHFWELGGNFLDTARIYGDWVPGTERSTSEKTIGKWMKARCIGAEMIVATKGGTEAGAQTVFLGRTDLIRQIEESCRNLQLDSIPLYYLHRDDLALPVEEIIDTLFTQQDRGLLQYLGCSNWTAERIAAANSYAASCGRSGFTAISNRWSLARCRTGAGDPTMVDMSDELYAFHRDTGIAAVPFSSTATGYLSKLTEGLSVSDYQTMCYGLPENQELAERVKILATKKSVSAAQIAIAYFYSQPFLSIPITAFSNFRQMEEAVDASDLILTADEYHYLTGNLLW